MGYFNREVYFYIFTATSNLFLPILNIFMHIPNYFHVYLYLYLTYLDIFSCIFIPIFMYISTYFYIFILISTYLLLFVHIFTYIYLYLPQKCGILQQIATKVCCFTTDCHKSVVFLLQFTDIYHISVVFYYSLTQKCGQEMYPKMGYKLTMYPKYPTWGTDGVQKLVIPKMGNI